MSTVLPNADALRQLQNTLPSLKDFADDISEQSQDDESDDEEEQEASRQFTVKRDSCWKQNVKVNADAQMDTVPEELMDSLKEFRLQNSNKFTNTFDRVNIPAYRDGTMTVIEPSLMKLLKSNRNTIGGHGRGQSPVPAARFFSSRMPNLNTIAVPIEAQVQTSEMRGDIGFNSIASLSNNTRESNGVESMASACRLRSC